MQPEVNPTGGINLTEYLGVFTRRAWLIIVPFVAIVAIAAALGFLLPPKYNASTRIKVEERDFMKRFYERGGFDVPFKPFLANIGEEVRRRSFLEDLIKAHGISEGFDVSNARERQKLFTHVIQNLKVNYKPVKDGPDIFGFEYTGRDAPRVARFVNAVRQKFLEEVDERIVQIVAQARTLENAKRIRAQADYDRSANALLKFSEAEEAALAGPDSETTRVEQLATLRIKLEEDEIRLRTLEATLDQARFDLKSTNATTVAETQERNPDHTGAVAAVLTAEAALSKLKEKYTDLHPMVKLAKEDLNLKREMLARQPQFLPQTRTPTENPAYMELDALVRKLQRDVSGLESEIAGTRKLIAKVEREVRRIPSIRRNATKLRLHRDMAGAHLRRVKQTLAEAEATFRRVTSNKNSIFVVLTSPTAEEARLWDPVFPNVALFIAAGALVGLLLGTGLAFVVEFSNQAYVSTSQVRRMLPVPLLGQVDAIRTSDERRTRLRKRVIIASVLLILFAGLIAVHVFYFNPGLQDNLPPSVFDIMKRIYGSK